MAIGIVAHQKIAGKEPADNPRLYVAPLAVISAQRDVGSNIRNPAEGVLCLPLHRPAPREQSVGRAQRYTKDVFRLFSFVTLCLL